MIGAAAVAVGAYADTVTTNGVTWTYTVNNAANKTITLGGGTSSTPAMPTATVLDAADIPWSFVINGETYTVTALAAYAFAGCDKLTGTLTIPDSVTTAAARAFETCKGLEGVSSIGGVTVINDYTFNGCETLTSFTADISNVTAIRKGAFQLANLVGGFYVPGTTTVVSERLFLGNGSLKIIFFGPNTTGPSVNPSTKMLRDVTAAKVFVPVKASWSDLDVGGSNNEIIWYGASTNLNLVVDDAAKTVTATPTDEAALVKVLESAPLFKTHFGWNTRVNVTNNIEVSSGAITTEMLNSVEFNTMLLTFKVKTQEQLYSVLAAVPQTAMLGIDPSEAKVPLTIPSDRALWVWLPGNGRYTPKINGLIISFY